MKVDIAIVGGGPAGSTTGALLKKYDPTLNVLILERELFPRDHVGESQTPPVSYVLEEMGCWQDVENFGFPVKVGATYCWGKSKELWDFDFMPPDLCEDIRRPGQFEGVRRGLAFQVERAHYDEILLKRAAALGCDVRQEARVTRIEMAGDLVTGLQVEGIGLVEAETFVDASGHAGILRRAAGVEVDCPTNLKNVAVWEYWRNAKWAEEIGVGATRVQVMSVGYGWIWFIPLGPERTSVGLIVPADYLKESGLTLPELYHRALGEQPRIKSLMEDAVSEGENHTTKDWSFAARRLYGENWFLVGESSGFADPILAAGLSLTHAAAREAAYTMLEERRGGDKKWLREAYEARALKRLMSHIRFADYWYTANSQFTDLKAYTTEIAKEAGLDLSPDQAWQWLSQGGFINDEFVAGLAGLALPLLREIGDYMGESETSMTVQKTNVFRPLLEGAKEEPRASYKEGRVTAVTCLTRNGKIWPLTGPFKLWHAWLRDNLSVDELVLELMCQAEKLNRLNPGAEIYDMLVALEALISDGWVEASLDPTQRMIGKVTFKNFQWHGEDKARKT
jgi:flavin-dependent dehydrogenase